VSSATALGQEAEPPPPAPETPEQTQPRICLSDDIIEGTLEPQPLEVPSEEPPRVCLSIARPVEQPPYLRILAGPALLGISAREREFDESGSGVAVQLEIDAGIWTSDSFGLAFGVTGFYAPSLDNDALGSGTFWRAGTVLDWFPARYPGFHGSLSIGPMYLGVERTGRGGAHAVGFSGGLWLGYDFPIADHWALGPSVGGSAGFGLGLGDEHDVRANARAVSILIGLVRK
jgi:hypothetical protein